MSEREVKLCHWEVLIGTHNRAFADNLHGGGRAEIHLPKEGPDANLWLLAGDGLAKLLAMRMNNLVSPTGYGSSYLSHEEDGGISLKVDHHHLQDGHGVVILPKGKLCKAGEPRQEGGRLRPTYYVV